MDTWNHYLLDLNSANVRYVVAMDTVFYPQIGPDYEPARNEFPFTRRLVDAYGEPLFKAGNFTLYRLDNLPESR